MELDQNMDKTCQLIIRDFSLEVPAEPIAGKEKLTVWLTYEVGKLIDHNIGDLLNILYRIDVSEQKTRMAFTSDNPSKEIARLIIDRELQKVKTREKYK